MCYKVCYQVTSPNFFQQVQTSCDTFATLVFIFLFGFYRVFQLLFVQVIVKMCLHCLFRFSRSRIVSVVRLFVGTMGVVGLYGIVGCCRIGDHVTINIEHCIHWILFEVNFTHQGSFTTCYQKKKFMKKGLYTASVGSMKSLQCGGWKMGLVFMKVSIISQMLLLDILSKFMETLFAIDIFQKKIIMSHPKYVVLDPLIINVQCRPFLLTCWSI